MTLPSSGRHRGQAPVPVALSVSPSRVGGPCGPPRRGTDACGVVA